MQNKLKTLCWKPIKGYEGIYEVSNNGQIKSLKRNVGYGSRLEETIRRQVLKGGYPHVALSKNANLKYKKVHKLVLEAFVENKDNLPVVNHIDGNKTNNNVDNLEWCTHSYNQIHAAKLGLNGGEKSGASKLTERSVKAIRRLHPKVSIKELSYAFGIGRPTINKIINKQLWKYV